MKRACSAILFLCLACTTIVRAQVLSGAPLSGNMVFTPEEVRVTAGCPSALRERLEDGVVVPISAICDASTWKRIAAPAPTCKGRTMAVLGVRFRGIDAIVPAESLTIAEPNFHIRLLTALEDAHGPWAQVEEVSRILWCTDDANSSATEVALPKDSCREPRQFAAAFDYDTPLSNKILTNGFSFFVRMAGEPPADFDVATALDDLRSSFGTALTIWMAALQDNDDLLTPAVRAFVGGRTYKSTGGYTMLLPPQVIRLACPQAATFIVEFNFGAGNTFSTAPGTLMLARARLEGRTIALNLRDVDCFRNMPRFDNLKRLALKDERCVNLLPVLAHELGHAFGMDHIPNATGTALMNAQLSDGATVPTRVDVAALVATLGRPVVGAAPGALEFRASSGLMAPVGWVSAARRPDPGHAKSGRLRQEDGLSELTPCGDDLGQKCRETIGRYRLGEQEPSELVASSPARMSRCSVVSTPSATTSRRKASAITTMAETMERASALAAKSATNERSILSCRNGILRR